MADSAVVDLGGRKAATSIFWRAAGGLATDVEADVDEVRCAKARISCKRLAIISPRIIRICIGQSTGTKAAISSRGATDVQIFWMKMCSILRAGGGISSS